MKTISLILLLTFIPFFKNFGYTLIFESEKVFIKTDTASFYGAISNKYPTDQISQIKKKFYADMLLPKLKKFKWIK